MFYRFFLVIPIMIFSACDLDKTQSQTIYINFDSSLGSLHTNIPVYHNDSIIGKVHDVYFEKEKFIAEVHLNESILILNKTNFYITEPDFFGNYEIRADLSFAEMILSKTNSFNGYIYESDLKMDTLNQVILDTTQNEMLMRIDLLLRGN